MRTTVTLDPDVTEMLSKEAYRTGKSFEATLNEAVRSGLRPHRGEPPAARWPCHDMGSARLDLSKALALAEALEDRELTAKLAHGA